MQKNTILRYFFQIPALVLLIAFLLALTITPQCRADMSPDKQGLPFKPGEKLVYQLRWGIIPAGEAVLEVLPNEKIGDKNSLHFRLSATSNSFVDTFYKVRDSIDSYTDLEVNKSFKYRKKQQEGRTNRDVTVRFDLENLEAHYTDRDTVHDPIPILPGTIDPLAALYYIRKSDMQGGKEISRPITDGKKNVIGLARIIKRESVTIRDIKYKTVLIEPDLKDVGGVFEKSKDSKIRLWITDDERRLLVKIQSKVIVGSFIGVLVESTFASTP